MPRPDLEPLNIHYRRIPILAIGRDVYLDTRLILRTLEALPDVSTPRLGASKGSDRVVEKLLEKYMIEGPVFGMVAGLVPVEVAAEPTFNKDRQGMLGRSWSKEELEEGKGECLNYVRNLFDFFESTVFEDGRDWVLGREGPLLADIEAIFLLDFAASMQLPPDVVSEKQFPKAFGYIERYRSSVERTKSQSPQPVTLDGEAAAKSILASELGHTHVQVDRDDPASLNEGSEVEMYPTDWVTEHRDRGRLVGLASDEVTIAVKGQGDVELRIHAPRTGFKIRKV